MKIKFLSFVAITVFHFQATYAQWNVSGINANFTLGGRVGIGTTQSDGKLDVRTNSGRGIYAESFGKLPAESAIYARGKTHSVAVYAEGNLSHGVYGFSYYANGVVGNFVDRKNNYAGYFMGPVFSTASFVVSDRKLKTNIEPLENALDFINSLKPKTYTFNLSKYPMMNLPEGQHFGLLADELETISPTLVRSNQSLDIDPTQEKIEFKSVNYEELIPILIKGMQEQSEIIQLQNERINQLENRLLEKETPISQSLKFKISPNPTSSEIVIGLLNGTSLHSAVIKIYSLSGNLVHDEVVRETSNQHLVNVSTYASGTYYCTITQGDNKSTEKFVVTK
jgi:hypothetical protein